MFPKSANPVVFEARIVVVFEKPAEYRTNLKGSTFPLSPNVTAYPVPAIFVVPEEPANIKAVP